jgi:hypothetical protein
MNMKAIMGCLALCLSLQLQSCSDSSPTDNGSFDDSSSGTASSEEGVSSEEDASNTSSEMSSSSTEPPSSPAALSDLPTVIDLGNTPQGMKELFLLGPNTLYSRILFDENNTWNLHEAGSFSFENGVAELTKLRCRSTSALADECRENTTLIFTMDDGILMGGSDENSLVEVEAASLDLNPFLLSSAEPLVGTWQRISSDTTELLEFIDDGWAIRTLHINNVQNSIEIGHYDIHNNTLLRSNEYFEYAAMDSYQALDMQIPSSDGASRIILNNQGDSTVFEEITGTPNPLNAEDFVGDWQLLYEQKAWDISLGSDGSMEFRVRDASSNVLFMDNGNFITAGSHLVLSFDQTESCSGTPEFLTELHGSSSTCPLHFIMSPTLTENRWIANHRSIPGELSAQ